MLAMGQERKTRYLDQVKCINDEEGAILVHEKDIKDIWSPIQEHEVKETLKRMNNGQTIRLDNILMELWKGIGDIVIDLLTKLFNETMMSKQI